MQHKHRLLFDYICANITGTIILHILSDSWCNQLHFGTSYNVVARILSDIRGGCNLLRSCSGSLQQFRFVYWGSMC